MQTNINFVNNSGEALLAPLDGKAKLRILVDHITIEVYGSGKNSLTQIRLDKVKQI